MNPGARVTAVVASRDSISFDIGDTVLVQADPRDAAGNSVLEASIDWSSTNPGVATVLPNGRLAQVIATAPGSGGVVAGSGTHNTTIAVTVVPPITATTLASHSDTARSLGDTLEVDISSQSATGPRLGQYRVVSRSNVAAVVLATQVPHAVFISAQQVGATWVVVTERHGTADSLLFVVRQRPAKVKISFNAFEGAVDRTFQLTAQVSDARKNPIAGQTISWKSLDTTIAVVDSTGLVTFRAADSTKIVATLASGLADTARAFGLPRPRIGLFNLAAGHSHDSLTVGVHELSDGFYATGSTWIHLRVVDTSIAAAPDSVLDVNYGGTFQVRGRRPGRTLLIGEFPLFDSDTVRVHVLPSRLALVDEAESPGFVLLGTDNAHFSAIPLDSEGTPHAIADTTVVTFHSSDSTVLRLAPNSVDTAPPGVTGIAFVSAHAADTGRAVIYATAPGFTGDSMVWRVLAGPKLRFTQQRSLIIGAKQQAPDAWLETIAPVVPADTLVATLTNMNPAAGTVPGTVTLRCCTGNGLYATIHLDVGLPGVDTIIAAAPGHEPDTAIITVTTPRFVVPDTVRATTLGGFTEVVAADSLGTFHPNTFARTLLATSSDSGVVRASAITFPAAGDGWTLLLPQADTSGVATVTISDSGNFYPPTHTTVVVAQDTTLKVVVDDAYEYGAVATGKRFESSRFLLTFGDFGFGVTPRAVHLSTTVPGVVRIPDSVVIAGNGYVYFPGVGGDTPGVTRIVATAHGFRPDTSTPVTVQLGHLLLQAPETAFVGGTGYAATVTALSTHEFNLPLDSNLTATLVPLDGGIAPQNAGVTIPAGDWTSPSVPLAFTSPGTQRLAAIHQRVVPAPYTGDTVTIAAQLPWLHVTGPSVVPGLTVGVGQRLIAGITRPGNVVTTATQVSVSQQGSHTVPAPSIVFPADVAAIPLSIDGREIGADTLVVAATGYVPDTVLVTVTDGVVQASHWPAEIGVDVSVPIQLGVFDATQQRHRVSAATTFTMQTSGGVTFTDGTHAITTITVPADSDSSPTFYVKGKTAGSASVWFVNVDYLPNSYSTTVR